MQNRRFWHLPLIFFVLIVFGLSLLVEASAWARAGAGRSFGSRGSRSYSAPSSPSSRSFGSGSGYNTSPRSYSQPYTSSWSRSPFTQGLMGGLAGGLLGNLLFGSRGYASAGGGSGGGMGLLDIALIGFLVYFALKFFRRRQQQSSVSAGYYRAEDPYLERIDGNSQYLRSDPPGGMLPPGALGPGDAAVGLSHVRQFDPSFNEEAFKELAQDIFFRIQAGWMNRSLDGIEELLTVETAEYFRNEFRVMKEQGRINRLENIAVRKVELAEIWQESGKDYITVLFTANLLDYTVDDKTGQVIEGDRLNPVKFQEFWTFCRNIGSSSGWQLSALNQAT